MIAARWRLALAALAFASWLAYLGYASMAKSRDPRVSQAVLAAAKLAVIADLADLGSVVKGETFRDGKPFEGKVVNLSQAKGFSGPGKYLLLLTADGGDYRLAVPPRSPGYEPSNSAAPTIYPWTSGVQAQMQTWAP